jgi:hypothetical protein
MRGTSRSGASLPRSMSMPRLTPERAAFVIAAPIPVQGKLPPSPPPPIPRPAPHEQAPQHDDHQHRGLAQRQVVHQSEHEPMNYVSTIAGALKD